MPVSKVILLDIPEIKHEEQVFMEYNDGVFTVQSSKVSAEVMQSFMTAAMRSGFKFSADDEILFQDISKELETIRPASRLKNCRLFVRSKSFGSLVVKAGQPSNEIVAVSSTNGETFIRHTKKSIVSSFVNSLDGTDFVAWANVLARLLIFLTLVIYAVLPIAENLTLKLNISGTLNTHASVRPF